MQGFDTVPAPLLPQNAPGRRGVGARVRRASRWLFGACLAGLLAGNGVFAADLADQLAVIRKVGPQGQGHPAAAAAWKEVVAADAAALPQILAAFDGANPLAANWLRGAVESIADRTLSADGKLPASDLENFVLEVKHDPRARRLAFEWLTRVDAAAPERLIPGMLNDPSVEFRRDAVQRLLDQAAKLETDGTPDAARPVYLQALSAARDDDQVQACVKPLEKLGQKVDLPRHFGLVTNWYLIGPFDNTGKKGFDVAYPPEQQLNLDAKYPGKDGDVAWTKHVTTDAYGIVDLAKAQDAFKGAVTYAYHEFTSEEAQTVDLRLGTPNAWKVWVNGELVFGRDEYHRGMRLDQYEMRAALKPGKNQILVKLCQNEQKEDWAQRWQFQLRVCDSTGTAVLSKTRPEPTETAAID